MNAQTDEFKTLVTNSSTVTVSGGRVSLLELEDTDGIVSIEILEQPEAGRVTVNPDNSLSLVLSDSDFSGETSLSVRATYEDGSSTTFTPTLDVTVSTQDAGWGAGEFYMLETDADDHVIVETGDNHRKVHVSNSEDALTKADIANLEGLDVGDITVDWLIANPEYGASPEMGLTPEVGMELWAEITGGAAEPSSNWLLFERGYTYDSDDVGRVVEYATKGEDPLHPIHITAYGEGDAPEISSQVSIFQSFVENDQSEFIVFSDLNLTGGVSNLEGENIIFENVTFENDGLIVSNVENITVRNSEFFNIILDEPGNGTHWTSSDRSIGFFASNVDGILIESNIFDHIGWADDFNQEATADGGQVPNKFTHGLYIQNDTTDVTLTGNVIARSASFGAMVRGGGFVEDNLFLDNNNGVNLLGGYYQGDDTIGNYTLFTGNVITSAGSRSSEGLDAGAIASGVDVQASETTLINNILAHQADPNNADEIAEKQADNWNVAHRLDPFYDDTQIYNWRPSEEKSYNVERNADQNVEGLDASTLDDTTIQNYAAELLSDDDATIADLMEYLIAQSGGALSNDAILNYFRDGFGTAVDTRTDVAEIQFVPNVLGDGIRWDNRLNWDRGDLPGTVAGDNVNLGGNLVYFGRNADINDLNLGDDGTLHVTSGRLNASGELTAEGSDALITSSGAGQFWFDGLSGDSADVTIAAGGGRIANTGNVDGGVSVAAYDGQLLFGTAGDNFHFDTTDSLDIVGSGAKLGFDGDQNATASLSFSVGTSVSFIADADGFSAIEEFRSGAFGDNPLVTTTIDLGGADLTVDFSGLTTISQGSYKLFQADEIIGAFGLMAIQGLTDGLTAELVINSSLNTVYINVIEGNGPVEVINDDSTDDTTLLPEVVVEEEVEVEAPVVPVAEPEAPRVVVVEADDPVEESPGSEPEAELPEQTPEPTTPEVTIDDVVLPQQQVLSFGPREGEYIDQSELVEFQGITAPNGTVEITLSDSSQFYGKFESAIGVYTVDENGNFDDIQILVGNTLDERGDSFTVSDIDAEDTLHFFLIRDGADLASEFGADTVLEFTDLPAGSGRALVVDGSISTASVLFSDDDDANFDELQHVLAFEDDDKLVVSFEDSSDQDFNDVGLIVEYSDAYF